MTLAAGIIIWIFSTILEPCLAIHEHHHDMEKLRMARIRLENDTFKHADYNRYQIPVRNESQPIEVYVGIAIRSLLQTDAFTQTMVANIWVRIYWRDEYIVWNPADYHGITYQTMPQSQIWIPELMLFNEGGKEFKTSLPNGRVVVTSEGNVTCLYPALVKFICTFNIRQFPFDEEVCNIELAPVNHDMKRIDLRLKPGNPADSDNFQPTSEWLLVNFSAHQHVHRHDTSLNGSGTTQFRINIYEIVLQRHGWSPLLYNVLPILIMHMLAISQFLLPCEAREKVSIGFTINLAMGFFLVMVKETFPETDYVAAVVEYISLTLVLQGLAQMVTIFVLIIHHKGTHDNNHALPQWARTLFLKWLAKPLLMEITPESYPSWSIHPSVSRTEMELELLEREPTEMEIEHVHIAGLFHSNVSLSSSGVCGGAEASLGGHSNKTSLKSSMHGSIRKSTSEPNIKVQSTQDIFDDARNTKMPENIAPSKVSTEDCSECKRNEIAEGPDIDTVKRHIEEIRNSLPKSESSQAQGGGQYRVVTAEEKCKSAAKCSTCGTRCTPAFVRCSYTFCTASKCQCKVQKVVQEKDFEYMVCCCQCLKDIITEKGWSKTLVPLTATTQFTDEPAEHSKPHDATSSRNTDTQDTATAKKATQDSATEKKTTQDTNAQKKTKQDTVKQNSVTSDTTRQKKAKEDTILPDTTSTTQGQVTHNTDIPVTNGQNTATQGTATQNADVPAFNAQDGGTRDTGQEKGTLRHPDKVNIRLVLYKRINTLTTDLKLYVIQRKRHNDLRSEWRQVAMVVDRLMFFVFLLGSGGVVLKLYLSFVD